MTYGNMSWHEYGQIGVDAARDQLERNNQQRLEEAWNDNSKLK